jgi:hypothetical protein
MGFSWWGHPPVEVVSQLPLCLVDSTHIWCESWSIAPVRARMLKRISPAPTSICAPAVLRNGRPRMRGDSFVVSMSSNTKSTRTK